MEAGETAATTPLLVQLAPSILALVFGVANVAQAVFSQRLSHRSEEQQRQHTEQLARLQQKHEHELEQLRETSARSNRFAEIQREQLLTVATTVADVHAFMNQNLSLGTAALFAPSKRASYIEHYDETSHRLREIEGAATRLALLGLGVLAHELSLLGSELGRDLSAYGAKLLEVFARYPAGGTGPEPISEMEKAELLRAMPSSKLNELHYFSHRLAPEFRAGLVEVTFEEKSDD